MCTVSLWNGDGGIVDVWKYESKKRHSFCSFLVCSVSGVRVWMVKRGSFTVEASLVIPFLCCLLVVFLQSVFYLHDVSVFTSVAYEAAQKGAAQKDCGTAEKESYAKDAAEDLLKGRRLACRTYEVEVNADHSNVCVTIHGQTGFWNDMDVCVKKEAACVHVVDFLRNRKRLERMGEAER